MPDVKKVTIASVGQLVVAPENVVYSTSPRHVTASDGAVYVSKGPDPNVVISELVAYLLAQEIGIKVPEFAVSEYENGLYFLSSKMSLCFRNIDPWLKDSQADVICQVCQIVVFDVWIMNYEL